VETFTIITVAANEMMRPVHDLMPAILQPGHYRWWLDEFWRGDELTGLLRPYDADEMECVRVSPLVNNTKNDCPECALPG
jgi:putative SOS response-associated peptidase YedK